MFVHVLKNVLNLNRTHKRRRVRYSVVFVILSTPPRRVCVCVCDFCRDKSRRKTYVNRTVLQRRRRKKSSENAVLEKGREQMFGMTTAVSRYLHVVCVVHGSRRANDFYPWWRIIIFFFVCFFHLPSWKTSATPARHLCAFVFVLATASPLALRPVWRLKRRPCFFSKHSPTRCSRHRTEIHSPHYQSTDNLSKFDTTI